MMTANNCPDISRRRKQLMSKLKEAIGVASKIVVNNNSYPRLDYFAIGARCFLLAASLQRKHQQKH